MACGMAPLLSRKWQEKPAPLVGPTWALERPQLLWCVQWRLFQSLALTPGEAETAGGVR